MVNIVKESSGNSIVAKLLAYCILLNSSFVPLALIPSHSIKHKFLRNQKYRWSHAQYFTCSICMSVYCSKTV